LPLPNFFLGFFFGAIVSTAAYYRGSLSASGALGATLLGTIVFGAGGLLWAILLVAFFVSSSLLSHYKERLKDPLAEKFQKSHRRDLGQVLANGGAAGLGALAYAISSQETPALPKGCGASVFFIAFLGALATVTADTWATELGVLSAHPPRMITTGRVAIVGTSGAITLWGTFIAFCGAAFIGITAITSNWLLVISGAPIINYHLPFPNLSIFLISCASGFLGSLFDSLLGATVQAIYFCDTDQVETESRVHRCGRAARRVRGWGWLDNDWVNFIASVGGSLIAVGLGRLL
jgi:uncharacterized protein (TIGR00297 family)